MVLHPAPRSIPRRATPSLAALCVLAWVAAVPAARAQEVMNIAAIVNDEVISIFDLRTRSRLVMFSSGLADSLEARRRIEPQILRSLIDERLQLQEAKRLSITVLADEIKEAFVDIETQNGLPKGQLDQELRRVGLDPTILETQIRSAIAWDKVVRRQIRNQVQIGNEEVQEAVQRVQSQVGRPQSFLHEIFLAVDTADQEDQVRASAGRLIEQIKSGTPFEAMARQFSQSGAGPQGGELGWVAEDDLSEELKRAVEKLKAGEISDPVRSVAGYHVLRVRERRIQQAPGSEEASVTLRYIYFKAPSGAPVQELQNLAQLANLVRDNVRDCADMERLRKEVDNSPFPLPEKVKLRELSDSLRGTVSSLETGKPSNPVQVANGFVLLMVCERDKTPGLDVQRIENVMYAQRVDILMRRYMRDLRRAAFVDVRI